MAHALADRRKPSAATRVDVRALLRFTDRKPVGRLSQELVCKRSETLVDGSQAESLAGKLLKGKDGMGVTIVILVT
jgi:hypothetical protein